MIARVDIVPPMPRPTAWAGSYRQDLYWNSLAAIQDLGAAWHQVVDIGDADVGDPGQRHIAAARLGRMICRRRRNGRSIPVSVVPCSVAVVHNEFDRRWDTHDHLLLVTDRVVADLGLSTRCPTLAPPQMLIERPLAWTEHANFLMMRHDTVTVTYIAHDRHTYLRSALWRRSYAEWSDVVGRLQAELDRVTDEREQREAEAAQQRAATATPKRSPLYR
jgi:hypothetical protein